MEEFTLASVMVAPDEAVAVGPVGRGDGRASSTAWTIVGISSFVKGSCTLPFFEGRVEGAMLLLGGRLRCG